MPPNLSVKSPKSSDTLFFSHLIPDLHQALKDLSNHPYPVVPSPSNLSRRASVAVIIRVQPHHAHWPSEASNPSESSKLGSREDRLSAFFSQEWVQHGDVEVLFIKRTSRKEDKWNGHIAFPGGKRDPEDADDCAAAIREAWEEVGIDLSQETGRALHVGNLPQKLITTDMGKKPLMIFCPYLFLLTSPTPPLKLQPTEVASTHWVPLRALIDPINRTYWQQDLSSRVLGREFGLGNTFSRLITGYMLFAAVQLRPSESKFCTEIEEYQHRLALPKVEDSFNINVPLWGSPWKSQTEPTELPLLLWGLTLGVIGDVIDMLPPYDTMNTWVYPNFSHLDVRLVLWVMSYHFRKQKEKGLQAGLHKDKVPTVELGFDTIGTVDLKIPGFENRYTGRMRQDKRGSRSEIVGYLLDGYFDIIGRAVVLTVIGRMSVIGFLVYKLWRRLRR